MLSRLALAAVLMAMLCACGMVDSMKEGLEHSNAVAAQLEKTTGLKSFVGFQWHNGVLTSVNVTFLGIPQNITLADIAEKSKQAIASEFKQTPKEIVISFSVAP